MGVLSSHGKQRLPKRLSCQGTANIERTLPNSSTAHVRKSLATIASTITQHLTNIPFMIGLRYLEGSVFLSPKSQDLALQALLGGLWIILYVK